MLCRAFPDTRFWRLGQANSVVVNGLGCAGLPDRVCVDGRWRVHDARAEVLVVLEDGTLPAPLRFPSALRFDCGILSSFPSRSGTTLSRNSVQQDRATSHT